MGKTVQKELTMAGGFDFYIDDRLTKSKDIVLGRQRKE